MIYWLETMSTRIFTNLLAFNLEFLSKCERKKKSSLTKNQRTMFGKASEFVPKYCKEKNSMTAIRTTVLFQHGLRAVYSRGSSQSNRYVLTQSAHMLTYKLHCAKSHVSHGTTFVATGRRGSQFNTHAAWLRFANVGFPVTQAFEAYAKSSWGLRQKKIDGCLSVCSWNKWSFHCQHRWDVNRLSNK